MGHWGGRMVDHQHGGSWLGRESWRQYRRMLADWVVRGLGVIWVVRSMGRGVLPAALEAVALAIHLQNVDMVGEPVQQCSCEPFRAKYLGPLIKGQLVVTSVEPRS